MSKADPAAVQRIIVNTINETARGDPDVLASGIVATLAEAGYSIVPANGREDIARGDPDECRPEQLYRSPNGDTWFFARDPRDGLGLRQASGECVVGRSGDRCRKSTTSLAGRNVPSETRSSGLSAP